MLNHFLQRSINVAKRPVSFTITATRILLVEISTHIEQQQTLSHLNAHAVNRPLHKNRKYIPKFSSGKIK